MTAAGEGRSGRLSTLMTPFGVLGCSQVSSKALPCSLCSTVKLARWAGEASRVLMSTHGLDTLPERRHLRQTKQPFGIMRPEEPAFISTPSTFLRDKDNSVNG